MAVFRWSPFKSKWLLLSRGASFEDITENGRHLGSWRHPTRNNQHMMLFEYKEYIWVAPYILDETGVFLKTLYPSRKFTKLFRKGRLTR